MSNTNTGKRSLLVWQGSSLIDGSPIGVFLTLKSKNRKTGDMVQATIIRTDRSPVAAVMDGSDVGICGDCKHRGINGKQRSCYVAVGRGPQSTYRAYTKGNSITISLEDVAPLLAGRRIRFGAYGDPAAVPTFVWAALAAATTGHTGYTHQWKTAGLQGFVMASVDSADEYTAAQAMGYRTFRVKTAAETRDTAEIVCPASDEAGKRTQCERCGLCNGATANDRRKSIVIDAHGIGASSFVSLSTLRVA